MAYDITITATNEVEVSDEVALACQEAYDALKVLPVTRMANILFAPLDADEKTVKIAAAQARKFVKEGKLWAESQLVTVPVLDAQGNETGKTRETHLVFARKGDIKGLPQRVSYRIYVPSLTKGKHGTGINDDSVAAK